MHISRLDNFNMFQINKGGNQLINEQNKKYLLIGLSLIENPKIKLTSDNKWICNKCTFHNKLHSNKCEMCFETKPPPLKHLTYKNMDDKNDAVYLWEDIKYHINTENNFSKSKKVILETDNFFDLNNHIKLQTIYNKLYDNKK